MTGHVLRQVSFLVCLSLALGAPAFAQTRPTGRLLITVVDPSTAVVANATVTVVPTDATAAAKAPIPPVKTSDKGLATIEGLTPGRYAVTAEFPGFDIGLLRDVNVRAGDNKHVVLLPLKGMEANVSVSQDKQVAAADPRGTS